ncbi:MAG TPA: WecB/TagA/CpsF family glycosyltransferase [Alloacidobacterium sp.]|jgi:N-acetylglucosaminyldiphosphoundecaprenol N-acetyl-beta-D-mannosaminyltransferase|nr:WecB/TagA/CpsF family glycosyltransferase [Alloacidobacterium sp.]
MTTDVVTRTAVQQATDRMTILGVQVEALSMSQLNAIIADAIDHDRHIIIANHNLHSIYLFHHDPKMRLFYASADRIHIDGMGVIGLGRLLGMPLSRDHRVTFVDWMGPLAKAAAENSWRIFYLGGRPGVSERGAAVLQDSYPGLQIETAHGFFDPDPVSAEAQAVIAKIDAWRPHLLITGMGMPRQEHWIVDHVGKLSANVILNGGAALDYFAGAISTPPRWAGRCGLEWFFRLIAEPRRLWSRYLVEPWFITYKLLLEIASKRLSAQRSYE